MSVKATGVIPARWGSTRFPGKSLAVIRGKPLVQLVYEQALKARLLDSVVVATDDERIRAAVASFGGRAVMTRGDHASGTDRVAEAAAGLDGGIVVNIQGDEPLIDPGLIDRLVKELRGGGWDMATAAVPIDNDRDLRNPSVVKVVWGEDGRALYFSRSMIPFDRDGAYGVSGSLYWRHLGIYAYTKKFLLRLVRAAPCQAEKMERLEQLRALHIGVRMKVLRAEGVMIGVDTPGDIAQVSRAMALKDRRVPKKRGTAKD